MHPASCIPHPVPCILFLVPLFELSLTSKTTHYFTMNRLIFCFLFSLITLSAFSQRLYFVYVQAEQEQPFYIRMNERVYSSTGSGYLILSRLRDTTYNISIGFAQNKWPEQSFTIGTKGQDHGFLLKNFGAKGWGLFDLQSMAVQMPDEDKIKKDNVRTDDNKDVSEFTDILAKATNDPSLREKPVLPPKQEKKTEVLVQENKNEEPNPVLVVNKEEPKKEETKKEVKQLPGVKTNDIKIDNNDTRVAVNKPAEKKEVPPTIGDPKVGVSKDSSKVEELKVPVEKPYKKSVVTKRSETLTTEGVGVVFTDEYSNGKKDTVTIVIPNTKPLVNTKKEEPKEEKKFLDISSDSTSKTEEKPVVTKPAEEKKVYKNNCIAQADKDDFLNLRKRMAGIESDDDMIAEARKVFRKKCFTVAQIKNLSSLFLYEPGKYKFFDAAYAYASDVENYATLQGELKEEYYIKRFKAMLR